MPATRGHTSQHLLEVASDFRAIWTGSSQHLHRGPQMSLTGDFNPPQEAPWVRPRVKTTWTMKRGKEFKEFCRKRRIARWSYMRSSNKRRSRSVSARPTVAKSSRSGTNRDRRRLNSAEARIQRAKRCIMRTWKHRGMDLTHGSALFQTAKWIVLNM